MSTSQVTPHRLLGLFLLNLMIIIFSIAPHQTLGAYPHPLKALVAPITKDALTSLYTISLNNNQQFLIDLTSPFSWSPCPPSHPTIPCGSSTCDAARSFLPRGCPRITGINKKPCTCLVDPVNPVTRTCEFGDLTLTDVTISATNGRNPTTPVNMSGNFVSSCAPTDLLSSLPHGTAGVAGLARSDVALAPQLASSLSIRKQFAICLPSKSNTPGVAFFGNKPFNLMPPTSFDVARILSYTRLLRHPMNPLNYYIRLRCVAVNGVPVPFMERMLEFNSLGGGGVMLSTAAPYTTLITHVYGPFLSVYADATKAIPRMPSVAPFELCLNSSAMGFTRVGYAVPQIDLTLYGGKNWTMFGSNSFKQVGPETACLAVVDAGSEAGQPAVTIGGFQMENNFLVFDLQRMRLGFSSTLFFERTTCGNFNFTAGV